TLVEIIVGRPVIDGDQAAMMGTAIDDRRRPTPRTEGVEVSDDVEGVFLSALAVDPRSRQAHAGQFWDQLEIALGMEPTGGRGQRRSTGFSEHPLGTSESRIAAARVAPPNPASFDQPAAGSQTMVMPERVRELGQPGLVPAAAPAIAEAAPATVAGAAASGGG